MQRPLAVRRHSEIVRQLQALGSVSVSELAGTFGVSHETVRRDLKQLATSGHLEIVHGGATLRGGKQPARADANSQGKEAIGRTAASLVADGSSVLLDWCSTTGAVARELVNRSGMTVCTNSLPYAALLSRVQSNRVFMLGGEISTDYRAALGTDAISSLNNFHIDIGFVGVAGIGDDGCPLDKHRSGAEIRGRMFATGRVYVVIDHDRFSMRPPFRVPNFHKVRGVIVDKPPEPAIVSAWADAGIQMIVAT